MPVQTALLRNIIQYKEEAKMKRTVLGAMLIAGLIFGYAPTRAEVGQEFGFKGLVLSVATDKSEIRINETWLKITKKTEVHNLNGNPVNAAVLKVGDRVRVVAEHKKGYDEALQIIQMPQRPRK